MLSSIGNFYERLVIECIHDTLRQRNETAEAAYLDDLACVALNYLPPRYVRHSVDLASHLTDEELRAMRDEVADAVGFAITTTQRRQQSRYDEQE